MVKHNVMMNVLFHVTLKLNKYLNYAGMGYGAHGTILKSAGIHTATFQRPKVYGNCINFKVMSDHISV